MNVYDLPMLDPGPSPASAVMPSLWRTARVFISSTFRDMHAERDYLVKVVFPELRERLLPHRIYLDDIDLRWGITEEESKKDKVLDLCLRLIDDCRPFFIGILGQRYGWVPTTPLSGEAASRFVKGGSAQLEAGQSVTELEILFGVLLMDPRMTGRSFFYFRDPRFLNAVPADRRREVRHEFLECATPEEVQQLDGKPARRAAAMRRLRLRRLKAKIRAIRDVGYPIFENYQGRWDSDALDRQRRTRGRLVDLDVFGRQVRDQLWEAISDEFDLQRHPPVPAAPENASRLIAEYDDQARFAESLLRVYVGREDVQRELLSYALGDETRPCLLVGPSGSGKSSVLARFIARASEDLPGVLLVSHFIGASSRSTGLRDMLMRLCGVLYDELFKSEEQDRLAEIADTGEEAEEQRRAIAGAYAIPVDIAPLVTTWKGFLEDAPERRRIVLVIDALNQLDGDRDKELWWLPRALSAHVKIIFSCNVDPNSVPAEEGPIARAYHQRPLHVVRVGELAPEERNRVMSEVPSLSAKALDENQVRMLLENPATGNPLYLRVALEELRGFGSFEELNDRIAALPRPGLEDAVYLRAGFSPEAMRRATDHLTMLFIQMIIRLEDDFSPSLVRDVLTMLAAARRGLSERELQDFLAGHPDVDDLFPILRQLRSSLMYRIGLIAFSHPGLDQAVRRYYFDTEDERRIAHRRLAECFERQDYIVEGAEAQRRRAMRTPPSPRPANDRLVDELPWQWLEAEDWDRAAGLLTDLEFLEAKSEAGSVFDLAQDFTEAFRRLPEAHPLRPIIGLLDEALRKNLSFLAVHPESLFQCLWNSAWWHDCPDVERHYRRPDEAREPRLWKAERWKRPNLVQFWFAAVRRLWDSGRWRGGLEDRRHDSRPEGAREVHPWDTSGPKLSAILQAWRDAKEDRLPGFVWVRCLRPPPFRVGSGPKAEFVSREGTVTSVAFSADGRYLASGTDRGTVWIWDTDSGAELARLARVRDETEAGDSLIGIRGLALSPDGHCIATTCDLDDVVQVWDAQTGARLVTLVGHENSVSNVTFSADGRRIVSGSWDRTVRVWDAESGAELACLRSDADAPVMGVAISPDGRRIASGSDDGSVRVWDAGSGEQVARFEGSAQGTSSVAFSPDGRRIGGGAEEGAVSLWDVDSGEQLVRIDPGEYGVIPGHEYSINAMTCIGFSRDCRYVVANSVDGFVRLLDAESAAALARFEVLDNRVSSLCLSPDGRLVAVGSGGTVMLWDVHLRKQFAPIDRHGGHIWCVAFSPDGRSIASGSDDGSVILWDAQSGAAFLRIDGEERYVAGLAFSPDGGRIVGSSYEGYAQIWDAQSGKQLARFGGGSSSASVTFDILSGGFRSAKSRVSSAAFSLDGRRIACGSNCGTVVLRDAESGVEISELHGRSRDGGFYPRSFHSVAFSPDGRRIACGSDVGDVLLWDIQSGTQLARFDGDGYDAHGVAFSPDGRRIASGSRHSVRVWDVGSGECIEVHEGEGDTAAIVGGAGRFPWRASLRGGEIVIESAEDGLAVAFFEPVDRLRIHPSGRMWAGSIGHHLCIIRLEGEPAPEPTA